jgi:hypothetical protein
MGRGNAISPPAQSPVRCATLLVSISYRHSRKILTFGVSNAVRQHDYFIRQQRDKKDMAGTTGG